MDGHFRPLLGVFFLFLGLNLGYAQCDPFFPKALSPRSSNYDIRVTLDHPNRMLDAVQTIQFTNPSPVPIRELRLYLYLNSFKNTESSFLKGASNIFGQGFTNRTADEWGWVDLQKIERAEGIDLTSNLRYIQLDDGNPSDQSVVEVTLDKALQPGETAIST